MRTCVLLMKTPCTEGESWRIAEAIHGKDDMLFLLGDAVMICRERYRGHPSTIVSTAVERGATVKVSVRDLRLRGVGEEELHDGIEVVDDIEVPLLDAVMEHAERVIAW